MAPSGCLRYSSIVRMGWRRIARRAGADAAKASKLDRGQAALFLTGQSLSALMIFGLAGHLDLASRIGAAAVPFLVYPVSFLWNLRGASVRIREDGIAEIRECVRSALAASDRRILDQIDQGNLAFSARLKLVDFQRLLACQQREFGSDVVHNLLITAEMHGALINNGSLGPTTAEAVQYQVQIALTKKALKAS